MATTINGAEVSAILVRRTTCRRRSSPLPQRRTGAAAVRSRLL